MCNLEKQVRNHFGWLETEYGFEINKVDNDRFKLFSPTVSFWIYFSMDLPRFLYFELNPDGSAELYDIWELLASGRRKNVEQCFKPSKGLPRAKQNIIMLEVVSCSIRHAGIDFIIGDKCWKSSYPNNPEHLNKSQVSGYCE